MANSIQNAEPTLASLLNLFKDNVKMEINCVQVGEIVSFDSSTQTAEVQIKMVKIQNGQLKDYPVLVDCPCIVLGGGPGRVTFPIQSGDSCVIFFNDRDIDNWYAGGQKMLPRTERKHSFTDAIALVGIHNLQNKITDYLTSGTELKYGSSTIKLESGKVTVTNGSAKIELSSGTATITATSVVVDAPTTTFNGEVIMPTATVSSTLTVQGKDIGPNHTHSGVQNGTSNTGGVV